MNRVDYLHEAEKQITGKREQDYGKVESNFQIIADYWTIYTGRHFEPHEVAVMMALLKIARIQNGGGTGDSYVDAIGYLGCAGELRPWKFKEVPKEEDMENFIRETTEEILSQEEIKSALEG